MSTNGTNGRLAHPVSNGRRNGSAHAPANGIATVQRTTLVDRAVESLLDAIRSGSFEPGSKLPNEHALAAQLGVSRTAAREALQRLVSIEVLQARHGFGYVVALPDAARAVRPEVLVLSRDPEELFALLEARAALEKELAALAAQRATEEDIERLRAAFDDLAAAIAAKQPGTEADVAFHVAIAQAAGNPFLYRLSDVIRAYLERMRTSLPDWTHDRSDVVERHRDILAAISERNPEAAATAMRRHMDMVFHQFESRRTRLAASA